MKRLFFTALVPVVVLTGCSGFSLTPYRPDVHQGNVVTSEMIESLHEGMTRNQVLFLLGSPTLKSVFHSNEWNYTYYLNPRNGPVQLRRMQVVFGPDGRVESFQSDPMPNETEADLLILGDRVSERTLEKAKEDEQLRKERFEATPDAPETPQVTPLGAPAEGAAAAAVGTELPNNTEPAELVPEVPTEMTAEPTDASPAAEQSTEAAPAAEPAEKPAEAPVVERSVAVPAEEPSAAPTAETAPAAEPAAAEAPAAETSPVVEQSTAAPATPAEPAAEAPAKSEPAAEAQQPAADSQSQSDHPFKDSGFR